MNLPTLARRLGWVSVSDSLIRKAVEGDIEAQAALHSFNSKLLVVDCKRSWAAGSVDYLAYCIEFDAVAPDIEAPRYDAQIERRQSPIEGGADVVSFVVRFVKQ